MVLLAAVATDLNPIAVTLILLCCFFFVVDILADFGRDADRSASHCPFSWTAVAIGSVVWCNLNSG